MSIITPFTLFLSFGAAAVAYGLWIVLRKTVVVPYTSSLRFLPGPPNPSFIFGHLKVINAADAPLLHEEWSRRYGSTFKYKALFNEDRFYTTDTRALNHILTHSMDYQKPEDARHGLSQVLGKGLLVAEGEDHRKQRRVMNPAFGQTQIRELTEVFVDKSLQLRDIWSAQVADSTEPVRLNILLGLSKMTLDVIGIAGFNYDFGALNPEGKSNELNEAFRTMFSELTNGITLMRILQAFIPPLRLFRTKSQRAIRNAQRVMRRIGMQLLAEKKSAILKELSGQAKQDPSAGLHTRDLLTLLLKANMAIDMPENQRLSDEDALAQVPTFLVAGHETTSSAVTWCLFALTQAPAVQQKLREELLLVDTDTPDMDALNALPYLDAVVRETMRVHAPVANTIRIATIDDVIPLGTPVVDTRGVVHDSIRVDKGQSIFVPILAVNRLTALWGDDAFEFKPERWEKLPEAVGGIAGVWAHLLSFLGGPRACIGYRFSIVEMKALVFTLVRAFEFELAVAPEAIIKKMGVVQRPLVAYEREKGPQMPMLVRPHRQA